MKFVKAFINFFILSLSLNIVYCYAIEFESDGVKIYGENFETLEGDIDQIWGSINEDSIELDRYKK